jgi:GNAT superfamily N-acetyltransferase
MAEVFGGLGCPHCEGPKEGFFNLKDQVSHIRENHPDKPWSARIQADSGHFVDYFPHMHPGMPHLLYHVNKDTGKTQGRLVLGKEGRVDAVETDPSVRRQGIATELWNVANELHENMPGVPKPKHSGTRTKEGEAWAKKVGGDLPERDTKGYLSQAQFRGMRWD